MGLVAKFREARQKKQYECAVRNISAKSSGPEGYANRLRSEAKALVQQQDNAETSLIKTAKDMLHDEDFVFAMDLHIALHGTHGRPPSFISTASLNLINALGIVGRTPPHFNEKAIDIAEELVKDDALKKLGEAYPDQTVDILNALAMICPREKVEHLFQILAQEGSVLHDVVDNASAESTTTLFGSLSVGREGMEEMIQQTSLYRRAMNIKHPETPEEPEYT